MPRDIDEEIARLKLGDDGRLDRHAHRGAGEVPGLVGRRHLSLVVALAVAAALAAPAAAGVRWRELDRGTAVGVAPAAPLAQVALDRAATKRFVGSPARRGPERARAARLHAATPRSPSSATSAARTIVSPSRG